jgi:hypothetical protein
MYDQEFAKKMTAAGGVGLADMMYQQLSRNLVSATRSVTAMAQNSAFSPTVAPLLPQNFVSTPPVADEQAKQGRENPSLPASSERTARNAPLPSIYDGFVPQHNFVGEPDFTSNAEQTPATHPGIAAQTQSATPAESPEISAALAQLRLQQQPPENGHIEAVPAGQGIRRHYPQSGLDLAKLAQREAGTKLGPAAVRPPLYPTARQQAKQTPETASGDVPAHPSPAYAPIPQTGINPQTAQEIAQQNAPHHLVRLTTNIPPSKNARAKSNAHTTRVLQIPGAPAAVPPLTDTMPQSARNTHPSDASGQIAPVGQNAGEHGQFIPYLTSS